MGATLSREALDDFEPGRTVEDERHWMVLAQPTGSTPGRLADTITDRRAGETGQYIDHQGLAEEGSESHSPGSGRKGRRRKRRRPTGTTSKVRCACGTLLARITRNHLDSSKHARLLAQVKAASAAADPVENVHVNSE